jgi:hypothetical protein
MAYTDAPSAVGTLRPAAAPRLALAAPQPDRRRALELLAATARPRRADARAWLHRPAARRASPRRPGERDPEHMVVGSKAIEIARVRITDAGRRALAR